MQGIYFISGMKGWDAEKLGDLSQNHTANKANLYFEP